MSRNTARRPPSQESPPRAAEQPAGRGASRRRAILDAAAALFLERGFADTSVGDVVKRSGGSLATLYSLFGSKEGLFEALVGEMSAQMIGGLDEPEVGAKPIEEALRGFAERFLETALHPEALSWQRMCVAEAYKFPELRAALIRTGPGYVSERLASYFATQVAAGRLRRTDPRIAAMHFFALIKSESHLAAVCGEPVAHDRTEIRRQVRRAVDVFLRGYGAETGAAPAKQVEASKVVKKQVAEKSSRK